jgi:hypothetical protein
LEQVIGVVEGTPEELAKGIRGTTARVIDHGRS